MSELPKGWESKQLKELFSFVLGGDWGKDSEYPDADFETVYCIRGTEFRNWKKEKGLTSVERKVKSSSVEKRKLQEGDILIEISGGGPDQPVGRTILIDEQALNVHENTPLVCTNFIRLARPQDSVSSRYLNYYLQSFYLSGEVTKYQGGSNNLRNLKFKEYEKIEVPIAPLEEQKRIADKLDSVLAKVEAAQARLDKIPAILKRFRQSVLAAATSGELTKEWRANKDFGKVVCIGDLTSDIKYGTSKKCDYDNELTPVLRIPNISNGGVDPNDMKYAKFDDKEFEKLSLKTGDILVIRSNGSVDLVGKSALVSEEYEGYLYAGYLIRLRLPHYDYALPAYIDMALKSPQVRKVIELNARSTSGVNNINSKELASLSFPLPDVQEQKEIITKVSELFGQAEKMERKYLSGKASLDVLTQSILSKAFSGKLS
ncbi:restriction endonuclease subunit S [Alteromonas sp. MB-3u-76]|uniref:restriction endonuclease subunit S n=1 Tax=Alteromonas sp. MB-3u-76 TaxID=2058133 RepID=UPI000C306968|nr:restriction endonuclease subunit S [Alteromonas sp. MB-3u-76]AUC87019.1 restriction endonuclease subunit S [Alteromonas sp. MB-3u-76]